MISAKRLRASSDSQTSTTRNVFSPCPAMCASNPSTGQSAGDSSRLLPPRQLADGFLILLLRELGGHEHDRHLVPPSREGDSKQGLSRLPCVSASI